MSTESNQMQLPDVSREQMDSILMPPPQPKRKRARCDAIGSIDDLAFTSLKRITFPFEKEMDSVVTDSKRVRVDLGDKLHCEKEEDDGESMNPLLFVSRDETSDQDECEPQMDAKSLNHQEESKRASASITLYGCPCPCPIIGDTNTTTSNVMADTNVSYASLNDDEQNVHSLESNFSSSHKSAHDKDNPQLDHTTTSCAHDSVLSTAQHLQMCPSIEQESSVTPTNRPTTAIVSNCKYDKPQIKTRFSDIIGHGSAKLRLDEMLLPLALPPTLAQNILTGVRSIPASILLYGPPGCGKTQLARAVAGEAQSAFLSIGPSDVLSKFVGESEASIRGLFQEAKRLAKRMESRCCVVFFDEIDALGVSRGSSDNSGNGGNDLRFAGNGGGGECSSRRVLAELLIQLTNLANDAKQMDRKVVDKCHGGNDDIFWTNGSDDLPFTRDEKYQNNHCSGNVTPDTVETSDNHDGFECTFRKRFTTIRSGESIDEADANNTFQDTSCDNDENDDGNPPRIIVIAATNRPEDCDPALLRRFAIRILVGLPSERDRRKIISRLLVNIDHDLTPNALKQLAKDTEGWSGSDLESVTREAVMGPIREVLRKAAVLKSNSSTIPLVPQEKASEGEDEANDQKMNNHYNCQAVARDALLNGFKNLRPVCLSDFENAISFWIGESQEDITTHMTMKNNRICHYDSDSTLDEDDFGDQANHDISNEAQALHSIL
jgi:SpoVK/Ycf46/Vps4 family AAA+-type ATPase